MRRSVTARVYFKGAGTRESYSLALLVATLREENVSTNAAGYQDLTPYGRKMSPQMPPDNRIRTHMRGVTSNNRKRSPVLKPNG